MAESPVIQIVLQRTESDCAIAALSMYLGRSYEDVLAVAAQTDRKVHRHGMYVVQIEQTAKRLGTPLRRRRQWDLETSTGILSLTGQLDHVVVLKAGLIFDTEGCVWEPEVYLSNEHYTPTLLLERKN